MPSSTDPIGADLRFTPQNGDGPTFAGTFDISGDAAALLRQAAAGPTQVTLTSAASPATPDEALWMTIRNRTDAISFPRYAAFINAVLCEQVASRDAACRPPAGQSAADFGAPSVQQRLDDLLARPSIYGSDAYQLLRLATQAFLAYEGGTTLLAPRFGGSGGSGNFALEEEARLGRPITLAEAREQLETYLSTQVGTVGGRGLPYLKRVVDVLLPGGSRAEGSPFCEGTLRNRLHCPSMMELIFDYWIEKGELKRSMQAVLLRFQNRRRGSGDPLVNLAVDPLQPLSNLVWGRLQDDPQHLSTLRRAYAYQYDYGLELHPGASDPVQPVESRTQFIESFHTLLEQAARFYQADADTTIRADGFPVLQALKDLHMVLAESFNNQSAEITRQVRVETLIDQYLFARKEMREFLRGRVMVPYAQAWMPQVETMKRLQGWAPQFSVSNFHILASAGEQLLLSARYADWSASQDAAIAVGWARYHRPLVQHYLHAYAAITGVDLALGTGDARQRAARVAQPALLMRQRAVAAQRPAAPALLEADLDFEAGALSPPLQRLRRPRIE
jgi:hypothetical protein